jgi:hypothetical protein
MYKNGDVRPCSWALTVKVSGSQVHVDIGTVLASLFRKQFCNWTMEVVVCLYSMERLFVLVVKNFNTEYGTSTFLRNSACSSIMEHVLPKYNVFLQDATCI